jgi:hypothetical protein
VEQNKKQILLDISEHICLPTDDPNKQINPKDLNLNVHMKGVEELKKWLRNQRILKSRIHFYSYEIYDN